MELVFFGEKTRLDKFLTGEMTDLSRSRIQKIIKDGLVLVNGKKPSVHRFLKEGDEIKISNFKFLPTKYRDPDQSVGTISNQIPISPPAGDPDLRRDNIQYPNDSKKEKTKIAAELIPEIIHEDNNILVINKPPGLLVHARQEAGGAAVPSRPPEPTLIDWLIEKYPEIKKVGDQPEWRPGIVHRLDKEASGVMVIAKTNEAFSHLKKQFHDHLVKKEYLALVYGKLETDYGKIELPVGRAEKGGRMAARAKGKEALTEFEVVERRKNCTLVKVFPRTGRTHQIRVHFFALGHPLVGDPLYQSKKYKPIPSERLMLHAHRLTLKSLDGEEKTFTAPIPKEFERLKD